MKTIINYDGKKCIFFHFTGIEHPKRYCRLCSESIKEKEKIYGIVNNRVLFPNLVVHQDCANKIGLKNSVKQLAASWEEAQKYKFWFEDYYK